MINNRQNGRRRGRGGNGGGGNNGQRGNGGRPDSGNRIDSRARGNANQLYEKYKNLARDAQMSGDRVNTEYYLQFADHYFRVLSESRSRFEEQNPGVQQRRIQPVDSFDDFEGDDDYGDEGEPIRGNEQEARQPPNGRDGYQGREQSRDLGRDQGRDGRQGGQRDGGYAGGREAPRGGEQPLRYEGPPLRAAAPEPTMPERDERLAATGSPVANDLGEDSPDGAEPTPLAPRRRGRPRRAESQAEAAEAPAALEADRLPPSLLLSPVNDAADDADAPKPRRRRGRPPAEATQAG